MSLNIPNTLFATGVIHCSAGLLIPELRAPTTRFVKEWKVAVPDTQEHYQREAAFWFQFAGFAMVTQAYLLKQYNAETKKDTPTWFGGYLTVLGLAGVSLMPASGFWLILAQGMWVLVGSKAGKGKKM